MKFDLGSEVFILPVLWIIVFIVGFVMIVISFQKIKKVNDEGDVVVVKRWVDKKRLRNAAIVTVGGFLILSSLVVTPPGHRAAIWSAASGVSPVERTEGVSFIIPIIQNATMINVREQKYENLEVYAQTRDLLEVTVQIAVNHYVEPDLSAELFRDVGLSYQVIIIEPAVLDIVKREIGLIDAADFPQQRAKLAADIRSSLNDRLSQRGIVITYVAIEDNIFDSDFVDAVLNKEIADENAAESGRRVEVARNEAQQVREKASGDADAVALAGRGTAEAIEAIAASLGFTPLQYLDWLRLTQWDGSLPSTLLSEGPDVIVGLP